MLIKFEDMFCTLEQAKQLKSLGVKQQSHFYWLDGEIVPNGSHGTGRYAYSAFSFPELVVMNKNMKQLNITFEKYGRSDLVFEFTKSIIYLIDNNKLTVEEINARFDIL